VSQFQDAQGWHFCWSDLKKNHEKNDSTDQEMEKMPVSRTGESFFNLVNF
jgi:hypothetical protein